MNHTPGPWKLFNTNWGMQVVDHSGTKVIAAISDIEEGPYRTDEVRSNAQLIVAAPYLLAACEMLMGAQNAEEFEDYAFAALQIAKRAVAQAKGES